MSWNNMLPETVRHTAKSLDKRAEELRQVGVPVYPPRDFVFRAFELTPPERVKVVIIGQDPYHGAGQANGLAFSVSHEVTPPPSLANIFKELAADLGVSSPSSGDLTLWAKQGVLLLNTVLTVEQGRPNSHKDWGWQEFTSAILRACGELPQPVVFILWGGQARTVFRDSGVKTGLTKRIVVSSHPSPLGAAKASASIPAFLGSRPFSTTNHLLEMMGGEPVVWTLP